MENGLSHLLTLHPILLNFWMSNYLAEKISKSKFLRVKPLEQQYSRPKYIIGFDSEADTTSDGRPMLFQFSLPETTEEQVFCSIVPETKHTGFGVFLVLFV